MLLIICPNINNRTARGKANPTFYEIIKKPGKIPGFSRFKVKNLLLR